MSKILAKKSKSADKGLKNSTYYHLMLLPGMIFLLIFSYIPMAGIVIAFQEYSPAKGILHSEWVGLYQFEYLIKYGNIGRLLRNTIVIAMGKIILGTFVSILFAILLSEIRVVWLKKSVQTIVYLPHFLSWVILSSVIINMFSLDGLLNSLYARMGFSRVNYLGSNTLFQPLMIVTHVWKEFGYGSIVYLAAITSVDPNLHEAATIDGAGWTSRVIHITLPAMLPIIMLMLAMNMSGILSAGFDQIYNLYNTKVMATGDVLDTYIYRQGITSRKYSLSAAVGLFKSLVGMAMLLGTNQLSVKTTNTSIF